MISKPLAANSFYHTCRYVCQKKGAEVLIADGVRGHDYKLMAADFMRQQQSRPSKGKAVFHSILSFHPDEKPSDEQLKEIALKYLDRLGIVDTQFSISKHTDKAHLHLHIVANLVDNNGKAISDSWIGLRGKKVAQQLTEEYGLIPAIRKDLLRTHLDALSKSEAIKYKIYQAIAQNLPRCHTMDELEDRLQKLRIDVLYKYKGQSQEKQGISFKMGNLSFKGSQIDRKYSLFGLQKILDLQQRFLGNKQISQPPSSDRILLKPRQVGNALQTAKMASSSQALPDYGIESGMAKAVQLLSQIRSSGVGGGGAGDLTPEEKRKRKKKKRPHF
ncbi:MAG TPA: relaxase/mobilization nuclease domain-containing protein [Puia sp.]